MNVWITLSHAMSKKVKQMLYLVYYYHQDWCANDLALCYTGGRNHLRCDGAYHGGQSAGGWEREPSAAGPGGQQSNWQHSQAITSLPMILHIVTICFYFYCFFQTYRESILCVLLSFPLCNSSWQLVWIWRQRIIYLVGWKVHIMYAKVPLECCNPSQSLSCYYWRCSCSCQQESSRVYISEEMTLACCVYVSPLHQLAEVKVRILEAKQTLEECVAAQDFSRAAGLKDSITELENRRNQILQKIEESSQPADKEVCAEKVHDNPSSTNHRCLCYLIQHK